MREFQQTLQTNSERVKCREAPVRFGSVTVRGWNGYWRAPTVREVPVFGSLSFLSLFFWNSLFFAVQGIPCFFERFSLLFEGF